MTPLPWSRRPKTPGVNESSGRHLHPDPGSTVPGTAANVAAAPGGVAAGGDVVGNAIGANSAVTNIQHIHPAPPEPMAWPVLVGSVPQLASAFQPRAELRARVDEARQAGGAVVFTQVLSGGGGVGKTQLAAAYAAEALQGGTELVVWAPAGEEQQIVAAFAQAAARVRAPGAAGEDLVMDAKAFLAWLATTKRSWLVVLDDLSDPQAVHAWWPASHTGAGWVLTTTRLHDSRLTGGGRRRVDVNVYAPEEARAYLKIRLEADGMGRLFDDRAAALAEALGYLPLALGHAAAYMINQGETCTRYLERFNAQDSTLEQVLPEVADADGYGRAVTTTLLLALEAADQAGPAGLSTVILRLAALCDPIGHPIELWTTSAALQYLTAHRIPPSKRRRTPRRRQRQPATAEQAQAALRALHRYALLTIDPTAGPRAVRVHALTARATREATSDTLLAELATAAASAIVEAWPAPDQSQPTLAASLRASTSTLTHFAGDNLWCPEGHPVLFRAGISLMDGGLPQAAFAYWQRMTADAMRLLGSDHPDTLTSRANHASSFWLAGRTREAIEIEEWVLADRERLLGPDHPETLTSRNNLAVSYKEIGRTREAMAIEEQLLTDRIRVLGPDHPETLATRGNLALSYSEAGRLGEAIELLEHVLADRERLLGPDHPDTLTSRNNLATSLGQSGRYAKTIDLLEQVIADRERLQGPDHPDTLTTRANLGVTYWQAGRTSESIVIGQQVLEDRERVLGPDHPDTLTTRNNLALSYAEAGRLDEAIGILERVVADSTRLLGPDHPDTLHARNNLAASYADSGLLQEAIELLEKVVADREQLLGPDHPDTLTARNNLAVSLGQTDRMADAIDLLERVAADREQLLGPDHPDTLVARTNLAAIYRQTGRHAEAIDLLTRVLDHMLRTLGPHHAETAKIQQSLQEWQDETSKTEDQTSNPR